MAIWMNGSMDRPTDKWMDLWVFKAEVKLGTYTKTTGNKNMESKG